MRKLLWPLPLLAVVCPGWGAAEDCNAPAPWPSITIAVPNHPFASAPTGDGCWIFVSGTGGDHGKPGIAVLRRASGHIELVRMVPLAPAGGTGMALSHDGKLLAVAANTAVAFFEVARLISGQGDPLLGKIADGSAAGSVYANITADDRLLFVSDETQESISVIDLPKVRANGYRDTAIVGRIPVGHAPIALTFSPDGKWLYTTSEGALDEWRWPNACTAEGRGDTAIRRPQGAVIVVDVARAAADPAHSAVTRIPAGCSPVRMAISPRGDRIYVTARNSNAVLSFDTAKLISDPEHARLAAVSVGPAPVPVAVIDGGRKVIAGNSNRFGGPREPQTLTVIDAAGMSEGQAAILGTIRAGAFPREMAVSADGRTLFLTNFGSQTLQAIDIARLPLSH